MQLVTSLIILVSALAYYLYYSRKYKDRKLSFLKNTTAIFVCVGLHQFLEFLTLITSNIWIYKIGLIISLSSTYFLLRSLEVLSNKKLHSKLAVLVILIIALQILISPLDFGEGSFYLKHNSAFIWAAAWFLLFVYWHICAVKIYRGINDKSKKTLIIYLLTVVDVSFFLSALYVLIGYFFFSVNVCTDAPSIWCTFFVVQSLLIPILFFRLPLFKRNRSSTITFRQTIIFLLIALIIVIVLASTLPLFNCLTWKLVFP